ncbi:MAG TPA: leucine-rich repeat domain-containing protein [Cyclobacteriaceae bacterium]|nr:leucine-rich repeat domain-containing protein [Cyclobacteriaceae bacterium]
MKRYKHWLIFFALLLLLSFNVDAQKPKAKKPVKKTVQKTQVTKTKKPVVKTPPPVRTIAEDEKRVRDIVAFLQYLLNTLGSSATSSRDKEVLVKESYSKIFRDSKVQIEDDLDEERIVITNKDIVPYLKDVDFFFKDVKFEFTIEDIKSSTLPNGELFYKVSTRRVLTGTTTEGKKITNTIPRYIEVNYHPEDQDLKIVSIYTNEINETEVLKNWWSELSLEWQTILRKKLPGNNKTDSLQINDIKAITSVEELDLSNNIFVQDIEPLGRLLSLKSLNLSGTRVNDLTPIRNLTELETLNLAHTKIADLSPLKYANKLLSLDLSYTTVTDISILEKMPALQNLSMNGMSVNDFSPISLLTELQKADLAATNISNLTPFQNLVNVTALNISGTLVQDLGPLKNLKNIIVLDIDSTHISNINALSNFENLATLHANYTSIANLLPLQKLTHLEKIYADHTRINREIADNFIATHPNTQVIFDTDNLKTWWDALSPEWQTVFSKAASISITPSKEEMAKVSHLDSINISGNMRINTLEPLQKLQKLRVIIANQTAIHDLSPLQGHTEIKYLDISETEVSDISTISQFTKLKVFRADKSKIENMERYSLPSLELFYADGTAFHDITAREFLEKNPKCLLIYKTVHLNRWWNALAENWKSVFLTQLGNDTTRENFHTLVEKVALHFKDAPVTDLNALSEFVRLKELHFSGTAITTIPPLENIKSLTSLHATNGPIQKIESLSLLASLEDLDISNTPIDNLEAIQSLAQLKTLNCAGTQIKRLDPLSKLEHLEYLDCSNTNANKLDPLDNLQLKTLKCYNTKISNRTIENFKAKHPDCNVMYYR